VRYNILSEATLVYCEKMDKKEFRVLMKHCFLAKKILLKPRLGLINIIWTLHQQNQQLRSGLLNLNEAKYASNARSGRLEEAVFDENIKKVHKIILNHRKMKLIEIAGTLKISMDRVRHTYTRECLLHPRFCYSKNVPARILRIQ
jgi:hypothetical protein